MFLTMAHNLNATRLLILKKGIRIYRADVWKSLKNTTFEAVKPVFTSGELFSIQDTYTDEEGTQHTETYPKPEFCICGGIKDNLDGTIFVEMFGKTDAEMEMEQMQQAYNILIGKEQ